MLLLDTFVLALKNIWSNKMRTILTMLGIIIGVTAVIVIVGLGNGMTESVRESFSSMGIVPRVVFESNIHSLIYTLSTRSHGVGIISQMYLYQPLLRAGGRPEDLLLLPLKQDLGTHHIKLVYRGDRPLPRYTQAFADTIRTTFLEYNQAIGSIISGMLRELPV